MPRLKGSADLLEDRRKRALALLDSGESINSTSTISGRKRFARFSASYCATCGAQLSFFWTILPPTRESPSNNSSDNTAACMSSTFLPMLRSSTRMKGFGLWQNVHSPTVAPMMWRSWSRTSSAPSTAFVSQLRNCAAAYCNPACLLFSPNWVRGSQEPGPDLHSGNRSR